MAVEVVLMVPILFLFLLLVVVGGRYVSVKADIEAAARDAARAASLERTPADSQSAANSVAVVALDDFATCWVSGVTGNLDAGGAVDVEIDCDVPNDGLGLLGIGGTTRISATGSAPIDTYRRFG
jgi:Flp pilus assembly protein TadG